MIRRLVAGASLLLTACAPSAPPADPVPAATTAPAAAMPDAATERADAILAEMKKREEQYQQAVRDARNQSGGVPVVTEYTPQAPAASGSAGGGAVRGEESWWRGQMRALQEQQARNLALADDALKRTNAASARIKDRRANYVEASAAFQAALDDYKRAQAAMQREGAAIERLQEDARRMNIPEEWLRWP